jgi:hypothetical protein
MTSPDGSCPGAQRRSLKHPLREAPRVTFCLTALWRRPKDLAGRTVGLAFCPEACPSRAETRSFGRARVIVRPLVLRVRSLRMTNRGYSQGVWQHPLDLRLSEAPRLSCLHTVAWRRLKDLAGRTVGLDFCCQACPPLAETRSFGRAQVFVRPLVLRVRSLRMTTLVALATPSQPQDDNRGGACIHTLSDRMYPTQSTSTTTLRLAGFGHRIPAFPAPDYASGFGQRGGASRGYG